MRAIRWALIVGVVAALASSPPDARRFNPAQREGAPYLFNITYWELNNLTDKWVAKAADTLLGAAKPRASRMRANTSR